MANSIAALRNDRLHGTVHKLELYQSIHRNSIDSDLQTIPVLHDPEL